MLGERGKPPCAPIRQAQRGKREGVCTLEPHVAIGKQVPRADTHKFTHASHKYAWADSAETGTLQSRAPAAPPRRPWRRHAAHGAAAGTGTRRARRAARGARDAVPGAEAQKARGAHPATHVGAGRGGNEPAVWVSARPGSRGGAPARVGRVSFMSNMYMCRSGVLSGLVLYFNLLYGVGCLSCIHT